MASDVDICNLALAHIGDDATVSSIDPPEGSAQAEHCSRFYPIARDAVLEAHDWNFASTRAVLAQVASQWSSWAFCYELPTECLRAIAVLPPDATDDYSASLRDASEIGYPGARLVGGAARYMPQEFCVETDANNRPLLYTNQAQAVLRYTRRMRDTTKFSPLMVDALSRLLASYLAGPVPPRNRGRLRSSRNSNATTRRGNDSHCARWRIEFDLAHRISRRGSG
ncbi:MAG: hypothetical protein ACN6O8_20405 [Achromobacter sp.]|uniref:hypothetical protein n=1 Tax=Achromobacter sp. TaxID=134375 RepID=UPI003D0720A7